MTETTTATNVSNFIAVIHGRGVLHTCIVKGTLDDVTQQAEGCLLSGFEVHVYALKVDTSRGLASYLPSTFNLLEEVFHMWDAADEISDLVGNITMQMDQHTAGMSKRYLQQAIDELTEQLQALNAGPETQVQEPTFGTPEKDT